MEIARSPSRQITATCSPSRQISATCKISSQFVLNRLLKPVRLILDVNRGRIQYKDERRNIKKISVQRDYSIFISLLKLYFDAITFWCQRILSVEEIQLHLIPPKIFTQRERDVCHGDYGTFPLQAWKSICSVRKVEANANCS